MHRTLRTLSGKALRLREGALEAPLAELATLGQAPPVRRVYAAAHVPILDAALEDPGFVDLRGEALVDTVDWSACGKFRRHLDALGFGVAEAMDTAQRFEIGWPLASRLIRACGELQLDHGFVAGAGHDQCASIDSQGSLIDAVVEQVGFIQAHGGIPILLPLLPLCDWKSDEDAFVEVYRAIIQGSEGPLFLHWLGEDFHPAMAHYFPGKSFERILELDPSKVRGAKLSLLDAEFERRTRERLLERDQIVLTGDDFHFGELILGDESEGSPSANRATRVGDAEVPLGPFSHGLLGIFDGIARPASVALRLLAHGRRASARAVFEPCEALGQWIFGRPTSNYKAGLAFLAWLNGHQTNPALIARLDRTRDEAHYLRLAELAAEAGALEDLERASALLASTAFGR